MNEQTKQYLRALAEWYSNEIGRVLDPSASAINGSGDHVPPPPPPSLTSN